MNLERAIERWFGMTDDVWERHANPWSVWTRYLSLPLLALAVWSRVWIGHWAWVPVLLSLLWVWLNPRVFSKPCTTESWAAKAVLGERVWLKRADVSVAIWHRGVIAAANAVAAIGATVLSIGLFRLDVNHTCYGILLTLVGKTWFLDRMVWLYQDSLAKR